MTIKEAAAMYGISPQAIYQRLKKQKIELDKLKVKDSQQLTADGQAVFAKLFTKREGQKSESFKSIIQNQKQLIESLQKQLGQLTEKFTRLQAQNNELKADKVNWSKALQTAQRLHEETIQRLLPAGSDHKQDKDEKKNSHEQDEELVKKGQHLTLRQRIWGKY